MLSGGERGRKNSGRIDEELIPFKLEEGKNISILFKVSGGNSQKTVYLLLEAIIVG